MVNILSAIQTGKYSVEIHCNKNGLQFLKILFSELYTKSHIEVELDVLSENKYAIKKLIIRKSENDFYSIKKNILMFDLELKQVLLEEKELQVNNRALLGIEYANDGYVFCFENGQALRPNYFSEMMKAWFEKKENKDLHTVTPHELRHSFVALAIAAGVPLYEISQALGHGDIGITLRTYEYLLDSSHINATESMAGLLRKDT